MDQRFEQERSKYYMQNANLMLAQQKREEEERKLRELKGEYAE